MLTHETAAAKAAIGHRLKAALSGAPVDCPGATLRRLIAGGLDRLPMPGSGDTLERWRALAHVAAYDLSLAKLYEGHTDALAILTELAAASFPLDAMWGVWCAEMPGSQLRISYTPAEARNGQCVRIDGRKSWCSGAAEVSHALVSVRDEDDRQCLAAIAMDQPGVVATQEGWHAVGMRDAASVDVIFNHAHATLVGHAGDYTGRPGFWHGAAGVAACWYGATAKIADYARRGSRQRPDPYRSAHLGAIDVAIAGALHALRQAAGQIDDYPLQPNTLPVFRARLAVETAVQEVMERASRALGAGPLCRDPVFARLMADLPVFVRQSHAEHDQAAHGKCVQEAQDTLWEL